MTTFKLSSAEIFIVRWDKMTKHLNAFLLICRKPLQENSKEAIRSTTICVILLKNLITIIANI